MTRSATLGSVIRLSWFEPDETRLGERERITLHGGEPLALRFGEQFEQFFVRWRVFTRAHGVAEGLLLRLAQSQPSDDARLKQRAGTQPANVELVESRALALIKSLDNLPMIGLVQLGGMAAFCRGRCSYAGPWPLRNEREIARCSALSSSAHRVNCRAWSGVSASSLATLSIRTSQSAPLPPP